MTAVEKAIFNRTTLLVGDETMERILQKRVIIFGVGGVGSWCAESLVRSGIHFLTMVDSDCVNISNVNRQLMATTKTIGKVKVEALKERLLSINPDTEITAIQDIYNRENAANFELEKYDIIIDAIDSLQEKADLIRHATRTKALFVSAMGAALKMDPTKLQVAEFWKVKGCPLARALREKFKRQKSFPTKKFKCVFSEEVLPNKGKDTYCDPDNIISPAVDTIQGREDLVAHDWSDKKAQINGTMAHITAIAGFMLAGIVMNQIYLEKA